MSLWLRLLDYLKDKDNKQFTREDMHKALGKPLARKSSVDAYRCLLTRHGYVKVVSKSLYIKVPAEIPTNLVAEADRAHVARERLKNPVPKVARVTVHKHLKPEHIEMLRLAIKHNLSAVDTKEYLNAKDNVIGRWKEENETFRKLWDDYFPRRTAKHDKQRTAELGSPLLPQLINPVTPPVVPQKIQATYNIDMNSLPSGKTRPWA